MVRTGAFSMLAETAEEFIQLECARRRNQASLKRRSSLPSQFHVSGHKSRLKEKLAQARRHAFLLRADNKGALIGIIDNVRELATSGEDGDGNKSSQRSNGPSPLERDRFMTWAAHVEKLLIEFKPSENHADDPLLQILEYLQFLQDGHVCLAEVAMDARALLERWDRSGVFDSESSSEEDDDDNDVKGDHIPDHSGFLAPDLTKDNLRHLEQSYAYQNVRQRAAASVIKRNVLTWVRSKASFCERVAEIEVFGRTTEALLKELSLTSAALAGTNTNGSTDIFALATGRCDPKSRYNGSIAFKDLLQFSKHIALFSVDQALRTVEDVTRRQYLFDSRCAMKIQSVWRRVRETVRARRLRRAMEELRLQREQEAQAKREAIKEAKRRKASEAGKRKVTKALKRSSTARSSVIASAISKLTPALEETRDSSRETSALESRASPEETNDQRHPASPSVSTCDASSPKARTRTSLVVGQDEKPKPQTITPRSRQRPSQGVATNNNDSDEDTIDVEAAWKSFMDTVASDMPLQEAPNEADTSTAPENVPFSDSIPPVIIPPMEDNWEAWPDDGCDLKNENLDSDDKTSHPLSSAKPPTPSSAKPAPRIKVVVSVSKNSVSDTAAHRLSRRESTMARRIHARTPTTSNTSVIRPPSSLPFDATLQNHTGPYTGAGQLSLMAPFIDADRTKKSQPSVVPEKKHLYELDYSGAERKDASFVHIARAITSSREPEEQGPQTTPPQPKTPDKLVVTAAETPRTSSRRKTVARLRSITGDSEQNARARNLLHPENQEMASSDEQQFRHGGFAQISPRTDNNAKTPGYFIYGAQGTMIYSPLSGPPEDESTNSGAADVKEVKAWHRSTIAAIPQELTTPHPPAKRFQQAHRRRPKGLRRQTFASEPSGQLESIEIPAIESAKRPDKRNELPLLLRRSRAAARRRERERSNELDNEGEQEEAAIAAPDSSKQMWKRGGELPELALAQIRDRIGYKRKSSHQKRMSIIAGRAPPSSDVRSEDGSSIALEERPETVFTVDEEPEEEDEDTQGHDDEANPDINEDDSEQDTPHDINTNDKDVGTLQRVDSISRKKSEELNEEFRRLHVASRKRELTRRRSLLSQLQSEEDAAVADTRRRSKELNASESRRMWRLQSQAARSTKVEGVVTVPIDDMDASKLHFSSSDEDSDVPKRRRLRIKTRDARTDFAALSDDEEVSDESVEAETQPHSSMTQQERDAAFQTLLTQYLGLLQCAPAEVARRLHVSS
ncbi:unnamed protein product [Phytophthora lilii]|uniref:Unnamed protein product n=1 Tax=Phytophthora lilii TaxID=2077276 RepID=A0A9W6TEX6_9STRA|nr:unnamed protein product [Phytophthora lilii]